MDRYTCFDTASLLSYPFRVALGDYLPTKKSPYDGLEQFHPVQEAGYSYGLIAPFDDSCEAPLHSLERLAEIMFFPKHMLSILNSPYYLVRFREFLLEECPHSLQMLTYYSNTQQVGESFNLALQRRVQEAPQVLTAEELPVFITSRFQKTSDRLAKVFCLTDPSQKTIRLSLRQKVRSPVWWLFSAESVLTKHQIEFHRTTQYGTDYVLGRNCRFFQGPKTNPNRLRRIKDALEAGKHHSELFLNYHHDSSPFTNILRCAPLCDSQGTVRTEAGYPPEKDGVTKEVVYSHEFRELSELFSPRELEVTHEVGGNLFSPVPSVKDQNWQGRSRACSTADTIETDALRERDIKTTLFRGFPSLRIWFTSPSLQIPGILQPSFLSRIGSDASVWDELLDALMAGHNVTAQIKWVTRFNLQGRDRWSTATIIACRSRTISLDGRSVVGWQMEHQQQLKGEI
ncbi:hypothetical protein BDV23DRAFT_194217 [Aspergillus alliaceus]|uniref:PAS domain-containing protein n=1 Tax=Petromyces alliaceus TaxID=209559 RepID=A0A5N7CP58_PETAA|nr:hypothetical protein BDV23DRAFT_194217 [Aspergillus alliaceus]